MVRPDPIQRLAAAQAQRAEQGLLRRLRVIDAFDGTTVVINGRRLVNFASNDYLGLAGDARVREALRDGALHWGVGSTAAHLLGGHREPHERLEAALADWTGRERALLFSTGYMANVGVVGALLGRDDVCVQDKLNHASLIDAARLSGCALRRYRHADVDGAQRQCEAPQGSAVVLASDGVFSMDGDVAPLRGLAEVAKHDDACLMIDDAHGIGVLGAQGAGSLEAEGLDQASAPILMATLGKALGTAGAFVAGPAALIEGLVQFARSHVYTTAMPPALAEATLAAVAIARDDHERRRRLHANIALFRGAAQAHGLTLLPSTTAIQPLLVGDANVASRVAASLEDAGFHVPAIRPPTVPAGAARLRITLSAAHSGAQIESLVVALTGVAMAASDDRSADPE